MTESKSIYNSSRLADGYAYDRPHIHQHLIGTAKEDLRITSRRGRALDIGCGAGLSTAALTPLAETVIGLEPAEAMLRHCSVVAPNALFLVGQAERLPFSAGTFDLIAAAGSLNYVDANLFFPEAVRVLAPDGVLIIYDFSAGRQTRGDDRLQEWFTKFEQRYPAPPGYELDVTGLAYGRFGLRLKVYKELEVAVSMTARSYLLYVLTETSVEWAISQGASAKEIRDWCQSALVEVFGDESCDVLFAAYFACVSRDGNT